MPSIPTPLRAALGLAATALDEARKLPETLPQVSVVAVTTAMQATLRVQQHIAALAARGDEVISQLRGTSSEPPSWATFDEPPTEAGGVQPVNGRAQAAFDRAVAEAADSAPASPAPVSPAPVSPALSSPALSSPALSSPAAVTTANPRVSTAAPKDTGKAPAAKSAAAKSAPAKASTPKASTPKASTPKASTAKASTAKAGPAKPGATGVKPAKPASARAKRSEPLADAARRAKPADTPNPATMAAEIVQAHQADNSPAPGEAGPAPA